MTQYKELDVCIVGGGFTGLNCALLLGKWNIRCEVFTTGYGASNLWMGTFDFLNYNSYNIKESFKSFKKEIIHHPYHYFKYNEVNKAFSQFFKDFQEMKFFQKNGKYVNKNVLTSLGTFKPCLGIWKSLFFEFEALDNNSNVILIGFKEFNNSALNLVKKGLEEAFQSNFYILNLSFFELYEKLGGNESDKSPQFKLSEFRLGRFFDSNYDKAELIAKFILDNIEENIQELSGESIQYYLFPPILGIKKNSVILKELSTQLKSKCKEFIALSPSLIANRLLNRYSELLKKFKIPISKGKHLINMKKYKDSEKNFWKLDFEDKQGSIESLLTEFVIFSTGTMFQSGLFENKGKVETFFPKLMIDIPNKFDNNLQLISKEEGRATKIYVCGSALYNFFDRISDKSEIKYGTGLGLPIISSYKVIHSILNQ
jgi:anaerobic glycerol-3-phosphate dehydrogenase